MLSSRPLGRLLQPEDVHAPSERVGICGRLLPGGLRTKVSSMFFPFELALGKVQHHEGHQPLLVHSQHSQEFLLPFCSHTRERLQHLFAEASRHPNRFLTCSSGFLCTCTHEALRRQVPPNAANFAHEAASDRGH